MCAGANATLLRRGLVAIALAALVGGCSGSKKDTGKPNAGATIDGEVGKATAAASAAASGCIRDRGGCAKVRSEPALALKKCEGAPEAMSLDEASKTRQRSEGMKITVRGALNLHPSGCTEVHCDSGCCNTCSGVLILGREDPESEASFVLRQATQANMDGSDKLDCRGDESAVCCPIEPLGQEVIVTGTLSKLPGGGPISAKQLYAVTGATICLP